MDLGRMVVRSFAAVSAGALPLLVGAAPAAAGGSATHDARETGEWTFRRLNGELATCTVIGTSHLATVDTDVGYDALASTEVPDTADTPCEAFVGVEVHHEDIYGNRQDAAAHADQKVQWVGRSGRDFHADHWVRFKDCQNSVQEPCSAYVLSTRPK